MHPSSGSKPLDGFCHPRTISCQILIARLFLANETSMIIFVTQGDDYWRDTYDTFENKQL